ncbi:MAG: hypothetical protein JW954_00080 [Dehalococcoidaceae bacterium]|nr:hypothetical protein [Dehalococcoidaceae bacterium]
MKTKWIKIFSLSLAVIVMVTLAPACQRQVVEAADNYLAIVPEVLQAGRTEALSISLLKGDQPAMDEVEVSLLKDGKTVATVSQTINGTGNILFDVPATIEEGRYEIRIKGSGFSNKTPVSLVQSHMLLVETDKPIYKPGQTILMRVLTLDGELKAVTQDVTVEVLDAKGIKVFRESVTTDSYGMAEVQLPLSTEPNLGSWKINAVSQKARNQLDIRVEEYVLPKYEVSVEMPKEWFLASEPVTGTISAEYSFGKPVTGELYIEALRYVGEWETYATITRTIDGEAEFEIPAVGYVAGTPASGGQGNIQVNITVEEKSTGYVEKTSRLLTVAQTPVNLQIIPESQVFKPGLPFEILFASQTPDNKPLDIEVDITLNYSNSKFESFKTEKETLDTHNGMAILTVTPPEDAIALSIEAFELTPSSSVQPATASKILQASYSPSGNFIHLVQASDGTPEVGQKIIFDIYATSEASTFYYEVIARGKVLFSDFTRNSRIEFTTTPLMAPSARLLVYQILPNSEVAADYLPFNVEAAYAQTVEVKFDTGQAGPGDEVELSIDTGVQAKVGVVAVDRSVFILAENRMNLEQVFAELEKLYMDPQAEIHEVSFYPTASTVGTADVFKNAGVAVMTNNKIPDGQKHEVQGSGSFLDKIFQFFWGRNDFAEMDGGMLPPAAQPAATKTGAELAEVERVRQFFPETWLWFDMVTDENGKASRTVAVPDSITTWMLRAVAVSEENGLGIGETSLIAFQPFFLTADLPYSAIRGEQFPVRIAVYNYLDTPQEVVVTLENAGWFELLDESSKTISIGANDVGGASFLIQPSAIGTKQVEVSARSTQAADALVKTIIIEPEGVSRELVDNLSLSAGVSRIIDTSIPELVIDDSGRAYIALTSSFLTQTIDGLEGLLQMPFGCGEQNMIAFAPDVYITQYLLDTGQIKPEILAKAEKMMITGYQRQMTYRRTDGSFSAFGMEDQEGSLWLTAFVLKSFSQAKELMYIDESVLNEAAAWITSHQNSDGSFDQIGFVHHQEMLGGLSGRDALTAFTAIALLEAGGSASSTKAVGYLEGRLDEIEDAYTLAITAYALEIAGSGKTGQAYDKLMNMAKEDENGLYWGDEVVEPEPVTGENRMMPVFRPDINRSAGIETTAYATLALTRHGDEFNASRAAKWLVSRRNAYGGYGSTQDTVITLQALTEYAVNTRSSADLTVTLTGEGINRIISINQSKFDVLQLVEVPVNALIEMTMEGTGDAIGQVVRRFNEPEADTEPSARMLEIDVDYDTTEVSVNDLLTISVSLKFNPLPELEIAEAGMTVLDISIPTGFEPVSDTIAAIVQTMDNIKRYEIAGRKVIFYVENLLPGDTIAFDFQVKALYPVKAMGVTSAAFAYYKPDIRGEDLSEAVTVN